MLDSLIGDVASRLGLGEQARPRLTSEYMDALVSESMGAAARRMKARNDPALALQTLGIQDPAVPAAPAQ